MAKKNHTDISKESGSNESEAFSWSIIHASASVEIHATANLVSVSATGFAIGIYGYRLIVSGAMASWGVLQSELFGVLQVIKSTWVKATGLETKFGASWMSTVGIDSELEGIETELGAMDSAITALRNQV